MKIEPGDEPGHAITQVERRIELRRARMQRHAAELTDAARERAKPMPLIAAGAVALAAFVVGRRRPGFTPASDGAPPAANGAPLGAMSKTGITAGLLALTQAALQLAANPALRAGLKMYARRRA